jgi:hypothetical protein
MLLIPQQSPLQPDFAFREAQIADFSLVELTLVFPAKATNHAGPRHAQATHPQRLRIPISCVPGHRGGLK